MVYVLSDIHGNERRFESILKQINLQAEDTLYILGDVIDRHPAGIQILIRIMASQNMKMLLGNHEYMMLEALGCPYEANAITDKWSREKAKHLWHYNGGIVTHNSFMALDKPQQVKLLDFLQSLPLNMDVEVNGQPYKLVHAAPVDEYTESSGFENPTQFAVWQRWTLRDTFPQNYTMVFGHTPTAHYQDNFPMEPWYGKNCICIDCGCGHPEGRGYSKPGRLACIRLDDGKVFYSEGVEPQ